MCFQAWNSPNPNPPPQDWDTITQEERINLLQLYEVGKIEEQVPLWLTLG